MLQPLVVVRAAVRPNHRRASARFFSKHLGRPTRATCPCFPNTPIRVGALPKHLPAFFSHSALRSQFPKVGNKHHQHAVKLSLQQQIDRSRASAEMFDRAYSRDVEVIKSVEENLISVFNKVCDVSCPFVTQGVVSCHCCRFTHRTGQTRRLHVHGRFKKRQQKTRT